MRLTYDDFKVAFDYAEEKGWKEQPVSLDNCARPWHFYNPIPGTPADPFSLIRFPHLMVDGWKTGKNKIFVYNSGLIKEICSFLKLSSARYDKYKPNRMDKVACWTPELIRSICKTIEVEKEIKEWGKLNAKHFTDEQINAFVQSFPYQVEFFFPWNALRKAIRLLLCTFSKDESYLITKEGKRKD